MGAAGGVALFAIGSGDAHIGTGSRVHLADRRRRAALRMEQLTVCITAAFVGTGTGNGLAFVVATGGVDDGAICAPRATDIVAQTGYENALIIGAFGVIIVAALR